MKNLDNSLKKEASPNLAGRGEASKKAVHKTSMDNLPSVKQKSKGYISIHYVDTRGVVQTRKLSPKLSKMIAKLWLCKCNGVTQLDMRGNYAGFCLRSYVYLLQTCKKFGLYLEFTTSYEGDSGYACYKLASEISFVEEKGFPEIRKYISEVK